jgi:DMSO reductase family type II enzyme heme b subunit
MPQYYRFAVLAMMLIALTIASCEKKPAIGPAKPAGVVLVSADALPADPLDKKWETAPQFDAPLVLQDMVDPRLMTASVKQVRVRAMTDGKRIAVRLEWDDKTNDDVNDPSMFTDACAIQLPTKIEPNIPAPQMGEPGRPVEITFWTANWQAVVNGREDNIQALYPNTTVDHYPFEAQSLEPGSPTQQAMEKRYAPAHAAGNPSAGPRTTPTQDLIAQGPGTISPAPKSYSAGLGKRTGGGWAVVVSRPLPKGLVKGTDTQVAFAVWEGSQSEAGSRKMRSIWIPLIWQQEK